ncbi:ADP-ribosylation factor-like protein 2, partial [Coemansia sp. RSA 2611]
MGLLSIIRKLREKEKEIRILVLGLDNAGKTTIMKRMNGESIDTVSPTLGFNITTLDFDKYKLNFWD